MARYILVIVVHFFLCLQIENVQSSSQRSDEEMSLSNGHTVYHLVELVLVLKSFETGVHLIENC